MKSNLRLTYWVCSF